MSSWEDTVRVKMSELNIIADWASIVNLPQVRDHCRRALYSLTQHYEWRLEMKAINAAMDEKSKAQQQCES